MMKQLLLIVFSIISFAAFAQYQPIGYKVIYLDKEKHMDTASFFSYVIVGDSVVEKSALLNIKSTTKGLGLPRMNTAQMNAIDSPMVGLLIYNRDSSGLCFYSNTFGWRMLKFANFGGTSYTFNNGLTETGGTAKLGGALTANTKVNANGFLFTVPNTYASYVSGLDTVTSGIALYSNAIKKQISATSIAYSGMIDLTAFGADSVSMIFGYLNLLGNPTTSVYLQPVTGDATLQATRNTILRASQDINMFSLDDILLSSDDMVSISADSSFVATTGNLISFSSKDIIFTGTNSDNTVSIFGSSSPAETSTTGPAAGVILRDTTDKLEAGFVAIQTSDEMYSNIYMGDDSGSFSDISRIEARVLKNNRAKDYMRGSIYDSRNQNNFSGWYAAKNFVQLEVNATLASVSDTTNGAYFRLDTASGLRFIYNGATKWQVSNTGAIKQMTDTIIQVVGTDTLFQTFSGGSFNFFSANQIKTTALQAGVDPTTNKAGLIATAGYGAIGDALNVGDATFIEADDNGSKSITVSAPIGVVLLNTDTIVQVVGSDTLIQTYGAGEFGINSNQQINIQGLITENSNITPVITGTGEVGTSTNHFLRAYIDTIYTLGASVHVGNAHITDMGYGANKVAVSDATGLVTWQAQQDVQTSSNAPSSPQTVTITRPLTFKQFTNIDANITLNLSGGALGNELTIILGNDGTLPRTVTYGTGIVSAASTLVLTLSKKNILSFVHDGTSWYLKSISAAL